MSIFLLLLAAILEQIDIALKPNMPRDFYGNNTPSYITPHGYDWNAHV